MERALEHARPRPAQPHYARFSQVFRSAVDGYLHQSAPLPDDIQDQLVGALKGRLAPASDNQPAISRRRHCRLVGELPGYESGEERRQAIG